jgi:hypothetical protein
MATDADKQKFLEKRKELQGKKHAVVVQSEQEIDAA